MQNTQQIQLTLKDEHDTASLAQKLASLDITGTVWLSGDLGAGKTTLTRYWLQALGHTGTVKSPTYTLVEPYRVTTLEGGVSMSKSIYHADLYRLQDPEELEYIGFDDYINEENALVIIEWASRALDFLPEPDARIEIVSQEDNSRKITISTQNIDISKLTP